MTGFDGSDVAVPEAGLLASEDDSKLKFDNKFWGELNRFMQNVEGLPETSDKGGSALIASVAKLKEAGNDFGSPRHLRGLLTENPTLLAGDDPPETVYSGIVWLTQALSESSTKMASLLSTFSQMESVMGGEEIRSMLKSLLFDPTMFPARKIRGACETLNLSVKTYSLNRFTSAMLAAKNELGDSFDSAAELLSKEQQALGGLQYKVESKEKEIDDIGLLASTFTDKKEKLEAELSKLKENLEAAEAKAEGLRSMIEKIEPVHKTESWLEPGLDNLSKYLQTVEKVWEKIESGMTQLSNEATASQLEDASWLKSALGTDDAINKWKAIAEACRQFTVDAMIDRGN